MLLGESLISWKCKKQERVSKSSNEDEYRAVTAARSEIAWLCGLLSDLRFSQSVSTSLYANNTSAIRITANPIFHEHTKHIEVDCHYIRNECDWKTITLPHISTGLQIVDIFPKSSLCPWHRFLVGKLMLVESVASIWVGVEWGWGGVRCMVQGLCTVYYTTVLSQSEWCFN